eukprot:16452284-Heterocapsa_arctica.AAC.2
MFPHDLESHVIGKRLATLCQYLAQGFARLTEKSVSTARLVWGSLLKPDQAGFHLGDLSNWGNYEQGPGLVHHRPGCQHGHAVVVVQLVDGSHRTMPLLHTAGRPTNLCKQPEAFLQQAHAVA